MTIPLVVDTDGAFDDVLAVWLAMAAGTFDLQLVTTVAGAVPVDRATTNMLGLLTMLDLDEVPVVEGAAAPLNRELVTSEPVLGANGMAGYEMPVAPRLATAGSGPEALVTAGQRFDGAEAVLLALGPLTNLAMAVEIDPDLLTRFDQVLIMGTATDGLGNITTDAEFNTWVDPEAAAAVFGAPGHLTVVGWQACRTSSLIEPELHDRIVERPTPFGSFLLETTADLRRFSKELGSDSYDLADVLTVAILLNPDLAAERSTGRIMVDDDRRGLTTLVPVEDGFGTATVVESADQRGFAEMVAALAVDG